MRIKVVTRSDNTLRACRIVTFKREIALLISQISFGRVLICMARLEHAQRLVGVHDLACLDSIPKQRNFIKLYFTFTYFSHFYHEILRHGSW